MPMTVFRRAMLRLRAILSRQSLENDMQVEMREHLDRATDRYIARGMSPADARLAARREFGNVTLLQEEARDARGARWVDAVKGDMRFAVRYFARRKATVAIIVAVLALGTGANTLIFSIFQAEFLRPPPAMPHVDGHSRIVGQERATTTASWQPRLFSFPEVQALQQNRALFEDVTAWVTDEVVLGGADSTTARGIDAQFITPNFFRVVGVRLAAGQGLALEGSSGADGADMTAVMAYTLAGQLYGDPRNAIGRQIMVNGLPIRVVGVAPDRFQGALRNMNKPSLWIPLSARANISRISPRWLHDEAVLRPFGRLASDASREQATAFARQVVTAALPDSAARVGMARTAHVLSLRQPTPGADKYEVIMAFAAIAVIGILILIIAWMNVSSLMVASAVGRRHEIAVRLSLGASRTRVLRQLVTESTALALAGGALGLLLSWWGLMWMAKTEIDGVDIAPDIGTFAFTLAIALGSGILFGLSPALHATRGVAGALRETKAGSVGRSRLQRTFVVLQIMLSQPLLVLLGAMLSLVMADYQPHAPELSKRMISVRFRPLTQTGAPSQRREAVDSLIPRIAERPGVVGAVAEPTGFDIRGILAPDRRQTDTLPTIVAVEGAAPGWFGLADVPIVLGRDVSLEDTAAAEYPIVIGTDLARALWGDAHPIGRILSSPPLRGMDQDSMSMMVVGVYDATARMPGMTWNGGTARGTPLKRVYTARGKHWQRDFVLVRTNGLAEPFLPELQRLIRLEAPSLPVTSVQTLAQLDSHRYRTALKDSMMVGAGGLLALLLASLGLYGVVSLAVQQRTREIGIRIAVGAHPGRVARMFLASGVRVSFIALLLGLPLSVAGLRIAISQGVLIIPGVNAYLIGAVITAILLVVASGATWIPARRAARVDPATTLREE